jgi:hypothetical protein
MTEIDSLRQANAALREALEQIAGKIEASEPAGSKLVRCRYIVRAALARTDEPQAAESEMERKARAFDRLASMLSDSNWCLQKSYEGFAVTTEGGWKRGVGSTALEAVETAAKEQA